MIPETTDVVFDENNGALVIVHGSLNIQDSLKDEFYGISMAAVKMRKVVQVYQWYETEDTASHQKDDANHVERSYSYDTDWFDYHIDSSNFANTLGKDRIIFDRWLILRIVGHHNPHLDSWPANSSLVTNTRVKVGGFLLGTDLKEKFTDFKPFTSDFKPAHAEFKIYAGLYYHSNNLWSPEVGDHRVQFSYAGRHGDEVTVVGRQSGRELRPYQTTAGEDILLLRPGHREVEEVFNSEHYNNRTTTWIYRLAGWLGLTIKHFHSQ